MCVSLSVIVFTIVRVCAAYRRCFNTFLPFCAFLTLPHEKSPSICLSGLPKETRKILEKRLRRCLLHRTGDWASEIHNSVCAWVGRGRSLSKKRHFIFSSHLGLNLLFSRRMRIQLLLLLLLFIATKNSLSLFQETLLRNWRCFVELDMPLVGWIYDLSAVLVLCSVCDCVQPCCRRVSSSAQNPNGRRRWCWWRYSSFILSKLPYRCP